MTAAVVVSRTQHQDAVRENIRDGAVLSSAYLLMNVLAATIATYGLFAKSPAVIISAMIVAVLLGPIVGVSLAGGAAGAYATVSPRLSIAVVGVAIAVALVPPLSAAGILFARGDVDLAFGALLLFFTNMVAIQFASSVVLWLTGFRRISRKSGLSLLAFAKGNTISIVILLALAVIFTASLRRAVAKQLYEASTRFTLQKEIQDSVGSHLVEVRIAACGQHSDQKVRNE